MRIRESSRLPVIALTAGDPCGVGPEIILKALKGPLPAGVRVVVIGDAAVFERTARRLGQRRPTWTVQEAGRGRRLEWKGPRLFLDCGHAGPFIPGRATLRSGAASLEYVKSAVRLAKLGAVHGLVTAPVTKRTIIESDRPFAGHTEYLARAFGAGHVVMMFDAPRLRVALLTRHVALRDVAGQVSAHLIRRTMLLTAEALRSQFGIPRPHLAVCGLNPHAGEGGQFGQEERRLLAPVMRQLRHHRLTVSGPYPADSFFADTGRFDAVICWYHDQGLIPFKLLAGHEGCQLSLGLPIVRTSPDHGSALEIAGKNCAHPGSMRYALRLAATLVRRLPRRRTGRSR